MSASIDPPSSAKAREVPNVTYVLTGTGTSNDNHKLDGFVMVDPATGDAMVPGSVTFTTLAIHDGDDAAEGATTDTISANTVIGRLKNLLSRWPAALTGSGNLKTAIQEALPAGSNTVGGVRVADGGDAAQGTTTDTSSASTVIGLLKAIKAQTLSAPVAAETATYSTTGPGSTVDVTDDPVLAFSLQVTSVTTGTVATSWTVLIEGSLDGSNWATVLTHTKPTDAESSIKHTVGFPVNYLRANVNALTLGVDATAISVSLLGKS